MMKWVLVLTALALLSWWITRPRPDPDKGDKAARRHIKMEKCPRCGVYTEQGKPCDCRDKA